MLSWVEHEESFITAGPGVRYSCKFIRAPSICDFDNGFGICKKISPYVGAIVDQGKCVVQIKNVTKTRLFKYTENFITKNESFTDKKFWYFIIFLLKT